MQGNIVYNEVGRGIGILKQGNVQVNIAQYGNSLGVNRVSETGYGQGIAAFPYIGEMDAT